MGRLPMEIFDRIISLVDEYPLSMEEARKIRAQFKEAREEYREQHTESMKAYLEWISEQEYVPPYAPVFRISNRG